MCGEAKGWIITPTAGRAQLDTGCWPKKEGTEAEIAPQDSSRKVFTPHLPIRYYEPLGIMSMYTYLYLAL